MTVDRILIAAAVIIMTEGKNRGPIVIPEASVGNVRKDAVVIKFGKFITGIGGLLDYLLVSSLYLDTEDPAFIAQTESTLLLTCVHDLWGADEVFRPYQGKLLTMEHVKEIKEILSVLGADMTFTVVEAKRKGEEGKDALADHLPQAITESLVT